MVLFFETYSIIQTIFLFPYIKKANLIYFHMRSYPPLRWNNRVKIITEKLIFLINHQAKIRELPVEQVNKHNWLANKKAIEVVEKLSRAIKNSSVYMAIQKIIKDENVLKCYKMLLIDDVSSSLLFFSMAREIIRQEESVYIIPNQNDSFTLSQLLEAGEVFDLHISLLSKIANKIRSLSHKIYSRLVLLLVPLAYIIKHSKKFYPKKINKAHYKVALPVVYGFYEGDVIFGGVKRKQDDNFLYGKRLKIGEIIHIFKLWRRNSDIEKKFKATMEARGIPFIDSYDYRMNFGFISSVIRLELKIVLGFFRNCFFHKDRDLYIRYTSQILYWLLNKKLELENVDFKVEFMMHDYNPHHVVDTIVCNQQNIKTVGIQHDASTYDMPQLCHVCFDKYIIYSPMYIKEFFPFWEKLDLVKAGRQTVDYVISCKDKLAQLDLKKRLTRFYPIRKYTVVIALSGDSYANPRSKWDELYNALYNLKTQIDLDFNLFLRFRNIEYLSSSENMVRFAKLPLRDERIIIDHINFTTYELMALSDLFIACNNSFSIKEAIAADTKVFTFNFHGRSEYIFSKYGNDLILNSESDVLRVFKGLNDNFKNFDCDWDMLKKDCNFHYDGNNLKRIQDAILSLVN